MIVVSFLPATYIFLCPSGHIRYTLYRTHSLHSLTQGGDSMG